MQEVKARDLQAKINALHNIETVGGFSIKMVYNKAVILGCSWMYRADSNHRTRSRIPGSFAEGPRPTKRSS